MEITLWSNIVQKDSNSAAPSVKTVKKAVRSVFEENEQSNDFVISERRVCLMRRMRSTLPAS
jgi:hypothetical protein